MKRAATAALFLVLAAAFGLHAQDSRSLTDSGYGFSQEAAGPAQRGADDAPLYEKLVLAQNSIRALTESLAVANSEAESFKRQAADLNLKLQALGIAGVEGDEDKIKQSLLGAVRELRASKKENEQLRTQLLRLSEAALTISKTAQGISSDARMALETELRRTNDMLGAAPSTADPEPVRQSLDDAVVVDVREDLSLIVANVGAKHGVKIGMPFKVVRGSRLVGTVRVVDVRDRISGAIIQNLESAKNSIKSGDRLQVDAARP